MAETRTRRRKELPKTKQGVERKTVAKSKEITMADQQIEKK
jgi:hypothetical protein